MDQNKDYFGDQQDEQGALTWVCPKCHTLNQKNFCCYCGFQRNITPDPKPKNPWKVVSIILIVVIFLFACVLLFSDEAEAEGSHRNSSLLDAIGCLGGHDFAEATCEEPKTCRDCGEIEGDSLGHDYTEATCTTASQCTRCKKTNGSPLSHNWQPATYESPKRCDRCGETTGNVKGYYATLPAEWNTKRVSVGGTDTTPLVFDETVKNCTQFTVHFQIANVDYGTPYGKFTIYAKINSKWKKIGTFNANDKSEVVKTFEFDDPISFKQLAVVGPLRTSVSYNFYLWIEDWYLRD